MKALSMVHARILQDISQGAWRIVPKHFACVLRHQFYFHSQQIINCIKQMHSIYANEIYSIAIDYFNMKELDNFIHGHFKCSRFILLYILTFCMKPEKRISEDKIERLAQYDRDELIEEILKAKENLARLDKKLEEQNHKYQKMVQSNMRNEKRLLRYRARIEEMGRYKDSPEHFLTMSGYMNECIQEYIFSHNYAFNVNPNEAPDPDNMTYEQLLDLGDQIGKVSKGLSKEQIEKLNHRRAKKAGESCPVCQNEIDVGEDVIDLKCKHTYHEECILFWLRDENTCPICKEYLTESRNKEEEK